MVMGKKMHGNSKFETFAKAMIAVLDRESSVGMAIIFTDKDLIEITNETLAPEDRVNVRSFENYKAGERVEDSDIFDAFMSSYGGALRLQRQNLLNNLADDGAGLWQKWAWIAERKFDDLNLRQKSVDETPDVKRLVFRAWED